MRERGTPRSSSQATNSSTWSPDNRMSSVPLSGLRGSMSYQARICLPALMVTGRTGAWGNTNRNGVARPSMGTIGSKS